MTDKYVSCPLCGHRYEPDRNKSCESCPFRPGCGFACCPECGYEHIDVSQSALVRWITSIIAKLPVWKVSTQPPSLDTHASGIPLLELTPGSEVIIQGFMTDVSPEFRYRMQAYGLAPGVRATILQKLPVVIIRVENLDLALEPQLASQIQAITV